MRDLWIRAREGDRAARDSLIERHMPLARSLAAQYRHAREPFEDLVQVANLGLIKAVDRFDPDRGVAFTSYAVPTILGELKRHFRDRTWSIHFSRGVQESIARIDKSTEALRAQLGHDPSARQVAEHCGMSVEDVLEARLADTASRTASLDAPVQREDGELSEVLGRTDAGLEQVEDALLIEQLASSLSEREREILRLRFVEDMVQREIAERVGISQMHVSRVLRQALAHLANAA
jgi:RNA polymerase sigma-B factor